MIIDFIIEDLMLNSYLQKNFHTLFPQKSENSYPNILIKIAIYPGWLHTR